jgi:hypothetical protein
MFVQDYRRHKRVSAPQLPVELTDGERAMPGVELSDISMGGIGVTFSDRLEEGQKIDFRLRLPAGKVEGRGILRWIQPYDTGYRAGVEFEDLGFWQRRKLGFFVGESFALPSGLNIRRRLDDAFFAATLAVVGLVTIQAAGIPPQDLFYLALYYLGF